MTLEDFFTLTEMKDGFTAPTRVEELVSVMKKEKDSLVKNVNVVDATRQWAAVASTIAATENKECLDLFVQLDGLRFIDRWLKDAQTFATVGSDCSAEEAISALLQAVGKLQIDSERLISSGICLTVKSLLSYNSTRVQDKARTLFNNWKVEDVGLIDMGVEKAAIYGDPTLNNEHPKSQSTADDVLPMRSLDDQKLECVEEEMTKISTDHGSSQKTSDHVGSKDECPDTGSSPVKFNCVEGESSVREEVHPSDVKLDPQWPSDPNQVTVEASYEVLKSEQVAEDARRDDKIKTVWDRLGKVEVSSASDDSMAAEVAAEPGLHTNDAKEDLSFVKESSNDTNQGEGCSVEETKDQGATTSKLDDVGRYDEVKRVHKSKRKKYFGNTCEFTRLTNSSKNTDIIRQTDMDLEDGIVDALEVARLVANEVEREVVGYDEQSGSSSDDDETSSRGSIRQPDSPESINGGQTLETDAPTNELPTMENVSPKAPEKEHLIDSANQDTEPENHIQDMESSQVTDALRDPEVKSEKSICKFDLNQEFSSEDLDHDLDHQVETISNPVSVVSAARAVTVMAPGMPTGPIQFEGTLGWKGSAATSAFRPASPRRASDSEKALSGGGPTSSGSRHRQDFLDIDLNVAEAGDDKTIDPVVHGTGKTSGESSVELSPKRSERLKFDLNQIGEDGGVIPASDWKMGGARILGFQNSRRSPSPSSSSSCLQPSMRNFDLNDNPSNCNNLLVHPRNFLGESSSLKITNPYVGPPDDSVISILGAKVKKNSTFPSQTPLPFLNGSASEPVNVIDASLLRGGALAGLGPAVPYPHSVYGYNGLAMGPNGLAMGPNGLAMGPVMSFPPGPAYGPGGPIPYMFDSRGAPVMPQIIGSASAVPSSYCQSALVMNMMGATPGSNGSGSLRPNLDLNSGYAVEGGNRDPAFFRQLFIPGLGQGRSLEEQLSFRPFSSGTSGGKRKEPEGGWELYPTNYKHHQPPHL